PGVESLLPKSRVVWQLLVDTETDDTHPLVVARHLVAFDTHQGIGSHPMDFLAQRRDNVKIGYATGGLMVSIDGGHDIRLVVTRASQSTQPRVREDVIGLLL